MPKAAGGTQLRVSKSFPKARGRLREIIDAYKRGELSDTECSNLLLQASLGVESEIDISRSVRQNFSSKRNTACSARDRTMKVFEAWMVEQAHLRPDTAHQYVQRIVTLKAAGHPVHLPTDLISLIKSSLSSDETSSTIFRNPRQAIAALHHYHVFLGNRNP